jgi:hypothetical protein
LCPIETEVYNFLIYLDYCIFTIRRFSQWYKVNVLYLCFICYRICCQLHTVFILMALYNESQLLWCVDQHLGVKPPPAKIQYVDGCKTECIIYLKRCRNYKKLLVVPTDSPYSLGANERLTLIQDNCIIFVFYLLLYLLPVAHSLHTDGTVQWKSVILMCRPTFRSKNSSLVKIQYVDGCKIECIIYLQRCRNYNKLLVVPTDSPYTLGAHELLTLIDTGYDCMDVW